MMVIKNASVYSNGGFINKDIMLSDKKVYLSFDKNIPGIKTVDLSGCIVVPGLADVHVHLREPGFSYKETVKSGTEAAAAAGYTKVFSMPNLSPVPDSREHLSVQTDIIKRDAKIKVYPYGAITKGEKGEELSDMDGIFDMVIAFSDDGRGVQNGELMKKAMKKAAGKGKIIAAHCEDNSLLSGGYIHDGRYAREHGHKGISSASEYKQIERDIKLAKETGVGYHVCHISCRESVELIRQAKKDGVDISCETAPHYLVLSDKDLREEGRFKMNPPIRSEEDRLALIEGIKDGTVDMIATDHAPHSKEEKSKGLKDSLMGIVGLETAFPVLYTKLVKTGTITLEKLVWLMSISPCRRFGLDTGIEDGKEADFCVIDLKREYITDSRNFLSKGKATPFEGMKVFGKNILTVSGGETVYSDLGERMDKNA